MIHRLRSCQFAVLLVLLTTTATAWASLKPVAPRQTLSLDGTWQIAEGSMEQQPREFTHTVPVPGLVDLAEPAFEAVGTNSDRRQAFWYRRTFTLDSDVPATAVLKLHKAKYGSQIWLNGEQIAEHVPCFTPGYFDVRSVLRGNGQTNELLIRIGANREAIPAGIPAGWDFEKYLYIPGIYDSVELILTGATYIRNVQVVPDIDAKQIRVVAEVQGNAATLSADLSSSTQDLVLQRVQDIVPGDDGKVEFTMPVPDCQLWTPEDPFLYRLTVCTKDDAALTRFGMRSFRFDPETRRAMLNGQPYYLRGSNITLYRFFEDSQRGDLPWRKDWVRRLHQSCKAMHWNSLRYCIGFPPEFWYDIADEEGILIQDEFPIWLLGGQRNECPETVSADHIVPQYTDWMRERWNHPCVVIWDAQNESSTTETGKALQAVRHLDLSNRPWENGWAEPQAETDCVESHPYLFIRDWFGGKPFQMSELATHNGVPNLNNEQRKKDVAIIINEYAWLWLTRDGNPTCLTDKVYEHQLGPDSTVQQRRQLYARYLAAMTEFWRAHRRCAGVLHFCYLGYSRPGNIPRPEGGATSDHWLDVEQLRLEPLFAKYVRDSFAPVGIMLDLWSPKLPAGSQQTIKVHITNDLAAAWSGEVTLMLVRGDRKQPLTSQSASVDPWGHKVLEFKIAVPTESGACTLVAELVGDAQEPVRSLRDLQLIEQ